MSSDQEIPNFDSHVPKLVEEYLKVREEMGDGIMGISFVSDTGTCEAYFVSIKSDDISEKTREMYERTASDCSEGDIPVVLIFHDHDKTIEDGYPQCIKIKKEPEDIKEEVENGPTPSTKPKKQRRVPLK